MVQLLVEGGEPERNFERAEKLVAGASREGCGLAVLPETIDFGWTHPSSIDEARPVPGSYSDFFCEAAARYGIFLAVGLTERREDRNYNSAILIDSSGNILLKYSKINLLEVEFPYYTVGGSISVVDTALGKIGLNICSDNYIESLHIAKTLASMGADFILSPASWTVDYSVAESREPYSQKWERPLKHVARLYDVTLISATAVGYIVGGPYEGKKMVGGSLAVSPEGIITKGSVNELAGELITFEASPVSGREKGVQIGEKVRKKGYDFEAVIK